MAILTAQNETVDADDSAGQARLALAHSRAERLLCDCTMPHPEMYVALIEGHYMVKRMPKTGLRHSAACASFEPPEFLSGMASLTRSAIAENPEDGTTTLKLDFALSKRTNNRPPPAAASTPTEAISQPKRLGLTGLLHYLWQEAELTKWVPAMESKRWWGVVRSALLRVAKDKRCKGLNLDEVLFVPEVFNRDQREACELYRIKRMSAISKLHPQGGSVGILIGEYKTHTVTARGARFSIRHLPDFSFFAEEDLVKRFERVFCDQLLLVQAQENARAIMIATFTNGSSGLPILQDIGMMLVNAQWLPFEDQREAGLLNAVVSQQRRFVKSLRFNLAPSAVVACGVFSDCEPAVAAFIAAEDEIAEIKALAGEVNYPFWLWSEENVMPDLPKPKGGPL